MSNAARGAGSAVIMTFAMIAGLIVWLATAYVFFSRGDTGLALIALFVPPADLVLAFVAHWGLGVLVIGAVALYAIGGLLSGD